MGELAKQDYFTELDRRDQEQIIMEAAGEASKELFYDVNGKKGLSYEGVNTVSFFMGDIETEPWFQREKVELNSQVFWSTTVRAVNKTFNLAALGTAEVPEMMDVHDVDENKKWVKNPDGSWKMHLEFDRFCLRKSMSMAQRNAKRAVMPAPMLQKFLEYFIKRAGGDTRAEIPYNPRKIPADYRVLLDSGGDRKEKTPPPAKTPAGEKAAPPPAKGLQPGKVNLSIIAYNLKALGYGEKDVLVFEEKENVIVEPTRDISEAEHYRISGTLEPMGAAWEEVGHRGRWRTPKKDAAPSADAVVSDLVNRILAAKSDMTRNAVVKLIEEEKAKAAGLLTVEAAAYLVASNLGVK